MRLANLRSGQLDFIERVAAERHRAKIEADKKLKVARITEIGYQGITINVGKSEQAQQNPLGRDAARARGLRARRSTARAWRRW